MVQEFPTKPKRKPKGRCGSNRLKLLKGRSEQAALNRYEAFRLRSCRWSYEDIAKKLGVNISTAFHYVQGYWDELKVVTDERAEIVRGIELKNLDELEKTWMPVALRQECNYEDMPDQDGTRPCDKLALSALDRILKIKERRAKIAGTDLQPQLPEGQTLTAELISQLIRNQITGGDVKDLKSAKPILELESGIEGMDVN